MSHNSGFFPSQNGDREYNADDFSKFIGGLIDDGIAYDEGLDDFKITAENPASMNLNVAAGFAVVLNHWICPSGVTSVSIPTASSSADRYDAVVIETDTSASVRLTQIKVIQGTAGVNPEYPTLVNTSTKKQIPLAYVLVELGATSIDNSKITDMRGTDDCPYMLSSDVAYLKNHLIATASQLGLVKASPTIRVAEDGTMNLAPATQLSLGGIMVGTGLRISSTGVLSATGGGGGGGGGGSMLTLTTVLSAESWDSNTNTYDLSDIFDNDRWDIQVAPCNLMTDAMLSAWSACQPIGSTTENVIIAKGTIPTVDITVLIYAWEKAGD